MRDDPHHPTPSDGLVPNLEGETNLDRLTGDTPDTFSEETADDLDNALPEVYPKDSEFEQELEDDESERYGEAG